MFRPMLAVFAIASPAFAENWPQWRGPRNDGTSTEKNLPSDWSDTKNVVWKAKMPGPGAATPCIWEDKIFLTAVEKDKLVVFCIGTDGKEKWKQEIGTGNKSARNNDEGNSASASCSTDGKLVFAFMGEGTLAAFTLDGEKKWSIDTQKQYGEYKIQFGAHWTPVLFKDYLYFTLMHRGTQDLLKIEAATGKVVWKVKRASDAPAGVESPDVYTSPFIWEKADNALLIVHGNDYCTAHKLEDGSEVWRVIGLNPKSNYNRAWRAVASPLVTPDLIVVPSCKNGVTVGIDPSKAKGEIGPGNPAELWRHLKNTPDVPSPLLAEGVLYIFKETQNLMAYKPKSGESIYTEKITNARQRANPVYGDGKLYLVGREGDMAVIKAGPAFELISKTKLPDVFTASPAISNGRIYLRGFDYLWCIGTK